MNVGQKVTIKNNLPAQWFASDYPERLNGEVVKLFDNGKVAVRIFGTKIGKNPKAGKVMHFTAECFV